MTDQELGEVLETLEDLEAALQLQLDGLKDIEELGGEDSDYDLDSMSEVLTERLGKDNLHKLKLLGVRLRELRDDHLVMLKILNRKIRELEEEAYG